MACVSAAARDRADVLPGSGGPLVAYSDFKGMIKSGQLPKHHQRQINPRPLKQAPSNDPKQIEQFTVTQGR